MKFWNHCHIWGFVLPGPEVPSHCATSRAITPWLVATLGAQAENCSTGFCAIELIACKWDCLLMEISNLCVYY